MTLCLLDCWRLREKNGNDEITLIDENRNWLEATLSLNDGMIKADFY